MTFSEWEQGVPDEIQADSVWNSKAYRLALFLADLAWHDATKLLSDKRTISLADQLYRAAGAISADIEEGYSRGTGRDRARFYEYALGSAREARGWYYKGRHVLSGSVTGHSISLLTEIIKLLLSMVPDQRGQLLHKAAVPYVAEFAPKDIPSGLTATELLENVPMPLP